MKATMCKEIYNEKLADYISDRYLFSVDDDENGADDDADSSDEEVAVMKDSCISRKLDLEDIVADIKVVESAEPEKTDYCFSYK